MGTPDRSDDELTPMSSAFTAGELSSHTRKKGRAVDEVERTDADRHCTLWQRIEICLSDVRQHGWMNELARASFHVAFRTVTEALAADPDALRWEVAPGALMFNGNVVWTPHHAPFDRIPYRLFTDGVRELQFGENISEDELRDLLEILARDLEPDDGDDTVTALWERGFTHVSYVAVDAFGEGHLANFAAQCAEVEANAVKRTGVDRDLDDLRAHALGMQMDLSVAMREAATSAIENASDARARAILGEQTLLANAEWRERWVDAFSTALADARAAGDESRLTDALANWTTAQFKRHDYAAALQMRDALVRSLSQGESEDRILEIEQEIVGTMFSENTLGKRLVALTKEGRACESRPLTELDPFAMDDLGRALELLGSDVLLESACECYESFPSAALREVLLGYIRVWAKPREGDLIKLLGTGGSTIGVGLVKMFAELGRFGAMLEGGLTSPHVMVQLETLRRAPASMSDRVDAAVDFMLAEPQTTTRMETLKGIGSLGLKNLGPTLVKRIKESSFHALSSSERRRWLEAIYQLNGKRGEELAIEVLQTKQLIATEPVQESRAVAALFLGTLSSKEALAAVEDASKARLVGTSSRVREAALSASRSIRARIEGDTR